MDLLHGLLSNCDSQQQRILKIAGCTAVASVCAFGGAFFFTSLNPASAAMYFASVAFTSQVAYQIFSTIKATTSSTVLKLTCSAIQLLQIPVWFYLLPSPLGLMYSGAEKLEIINAAAHFLATPIFFHLAIEAYKDPTIANVAYAVGVLLPLGSGLGAYAKTFRGS